MNNKPQPHKRHWPDCAVNHGPPGTSCDMGPECGTATSTMCYHCGSHPAGHPLPSQRVGYRCSTCDALGTWDGLIHADLADPLISDLDALIDRMRSGTDNDPADTVDSLAVIVKKLVELIKAGS